jgi:hypothetical protein
LKKNFQEIKQEMAKMRRKNKALPRNYRFINVHPIAGALGAEIKGVNIALPLKREVVLEIRQAFLLELV